MLARLPNRYVPLAVKLAAKLILALVPLMCPAVQATVKLPLALAVTVLTKLSKIVCVTSACIWLLRPFI